MEHLESFEIISTIVVVSLACSFRRIVMAAIVIKTLRGEMMKLEIKHT